MLEEICIRRRAGRKYESGAVLHSRWTIITSLSHTGTGASDGCFNRGIKLVRDNNTGALCVLKLLAPDMIMPGYAAREIQIMRQLKRSSIGGQGHANVLRILDFDDGSRHPHDTPWIVTEFSDAGTLASVVHTHADKLLRLPEAFIWHVFEGLAEAVLFCHNRNTVHRDISLTNVFLRSSRNSDGSYAYPQVQLGDFGCAVTGEDAAERPLSDFIPGNPRFMPPEGCEVDEAVDVYQLGLVVLCLGMCDLEPAECIGDFLEEPHSWRGDGAKDVQSLVKWCLARDPEQRPSAELLVEKLRGLRAERERHGLGLRMEALVEASEDLELNSGSVGSSRGLVPEIVVQ